MRVTYLPDYIWIFITKAEAEGARRIEGRSGIFVDGEDKEKRKYFLINTEWPENYVQCIGPGEDSRGHHTIKINDRAHADLLEKGQIKGTFGKIGIEIIIDETIAEKLLNKQG